MSHSTGEVNEKVRGLVDNIHEYMSAQQELNTTYRRIFKLCLKHLTNPQHNRQEKEKLLKLLKSITNEEKQNE